jgi:hypothetical protein
MKVAPRLPSPRVAGACCLAKLGLTPAAKLLDLEVGVRCLCRDDQMATRAKTFNVARRTRAAKAGQ